MRRLLTILVALAPAALQAAGSMDGTYVADQFGVENPVQARLTVDGSKATMIVHEPDRPQSLEFGVWIEGNMLVLTAQGGRRGDGGLVFYRGSGRSPTLECMMCGKVGVPITWIRVAPANDGAR